MLTVDGCNWSSLKMAWMHTVCVGLDLAEAKVCVWLNAPLDRTGNPFIFACSGAHITPKPIHHRACSFLPCKVKMALYKHVEMRERNLRAITHFFQKVAHARIGLRVKVNKKPSLYLQSE